MNTVGYGDTGMNLRVDGVAPTHQSQSISGSGYVDGSTYWVNSGDSLTIKVRQRDAHSGNKYQYLRALNNGNTSDIEARSQHSFSGATTHNSKQVSSTNFNISSAKRTEDTTYGTVEWTAIPRGHGKLFTVQRYYQDNVNNNSGYTTIGTVGVDDEAPVVQYRNKADSSNYPSQDWTNKVIDVRLKFSDDESGYKRSRYVWTKSATTPTESQWSSWSTSSNYLVSQSNSGEWYLHVQAEDNLGNKITTKTGLYKINQPPVAKFSYSTPNYEGDAITLTNLSTDPEGHSMTALWTVTEPNGQTKTYTSWDLTIPKAQGWDYQVTLKVTDQVGASDETSSVITVIPLILEGTVSHTEYWQTIHDYYEHDADQYYSGEVFVLEALVTNYPIKKVEVDLVGTIKTGKNVTINQELDYTSETTGIKTYNGRMYQEFMSMPETMFENGSTVYFRFKAEYENGIVKEDIVQVKIVDNIYEPFELHRTN